MLSVRSRAYKIAFITWGKNAQNAAAKKEKQTLGADQRQYKALSI